MLRFFHSADWQLGARFSQFGARGAHLRSARLQTLQRALERARSESVDAFLIAGDLFEDNQVDDVLVSSVVTLFADFPTVPIFILPGNHDPFTGPDSIWQRRSWLQAAAHVHTFTEPRAVPLGPQAFILGSPLLQKLSTLDPSHKLIALAANVPANAYKIGLTHGALAIEGKHQPNDFPIALNAASRAGLDYLGIGHWHNWLGETDGGRIVMPGTPEPDRFGNEHAGHIALVEIDAPGQLPRVQAIPVRTLTWQAIAFDFSSSEAARASLDHLIATRATDPQRAVLRVTLTGTASPQSLAETRTWLEARLAPFLIGQIQDETALALTSAELEELRRRHPLLTQILADVDRLETLATGLTSTAVGPAAAAQEQLSLSEVQQLLGPAKIELARLTPADFTQIRQTLLRTLQEVAP